MGRIPRALAAIDGTSQWLLFAFRIAVGVFLGKQAPGLYLLVVVSNGVTAATRMMA